MKKLPPAIKLRAQNIITSSIGTLLLAVTILLGNLGMIHQMHNLRDAINTVDAKVDLSNPGKATLTNGSTCILDQTALADEQLAIRLVQACVKAQALRNDEAALTEQPVRGD